MKNKTSDVFTRFMEACDPLWQLPRCANCRRRRTEERKNLGVMKIKFDGIIIGLATFLIIGALHPVVTKAEYYIGAKVWPAFLIAGLLSLAISLYSINFILSSVMGVLGFSLLWSILELFHQRKRVEKGWFPANPHKDKQAWTLTANHSAALSAISPWSTIFPFLYLSSASKEIFFSSLRIA